MREGHVHEDDVEGPLDVAGVCVHVPSVLQLHVLAIAHRLLRALPPHRRRRPPHEVTCAQRRRPATYAVRWAVRGRIIELPCSLHKHHRTWSTRNVHGSLSATEPPMSGSDRLRTHELRYLNTLQQEQPRLTRILSECTRSWQDLWVHCTKGALTAQLQVQDGLLLALDCTYRAAPRAQRQLQHLPHHVAGLHQQHLHSTSRCTDRTT